MAGKSKKAKQAKELPYEVRRWKGLDQWCCKLCAFDTLDGEEAIQKHYSDVHVPKPRTTVSGLVVADRWGRETDLAPTAEEGE